MGKSLRKGNKFFFVLTVLITIVLCLVSASALVIKDVETSPAEISPGNTAKITLDIENNLADDVENINVMLDFSSQTIPIAPFEGSSEKSIEDLDSDDDDKISFNVIILPGAASGIYKIPVRIDYNVVGSNQTQTKNSTISVVVNSPAQVKVAIEGNVVKGIQSNLVLRIINDGLSDIKLASVKISQQSYFTLKSASYEYVGNIDSDDFDSIDLELVASENAPSEINIPVTISYKDATNKDFTRTETVNLRAYSQDEAKALGIVEPKSHRIFFLGGIVIIVYFAYWIRKRMKRKQAQIGG